MDNASKALIMAGAILIAVALVGMGVYLVSIISNPSESAVTLIDTQDIIAKNRQIENYCGDSVKGSEVKALLDLVKIMNKQEYFPNPITVTTSGDIVTSARYNVTCEYDTDGYVNKISYTKTTT